MGQCRDFCDSVAWNTFSDSVCAYDCSSCFYVLLDDFNPDAKSGIVITYGDGPDALKQELTESQVLALTFFDTFRGAILGDFIAKTRAEFDSHPEAVPSCFSQDPLSEQDREFFVDAINNLEKGINEFLNEFGDNNALNF